MEFAELVSKKIKSWGGIIQIIHNNTSDAVIAASIFGRSFYSTSRPCIIFQATDDDYIEKIKRRNPLATIFIGFRSDPSIASTFEFPQLYISHSNGKNDEIKISDNHPIFLNSDNYGFHNQETSLSAMSYFVCSYLITNLDYIVQLPLLAAQSVSLYSKNSGLHDLILQDAVAGNVAESKKLLSLLGGSIFSIHEGLLYANDPYLPGITGNENAVHKLLLKADIELDSEKGVRKLQELSKDEMTDVNNQLIMKLSSQEGFQRENLIFVKEGQILLNEKLSTITRNTWDFATAVKDAINRNQTSLAISVLIGNRSDHLIKLTKLFTEERKAPAISYQLIEDKRDQIVDLSKLRYFKSDRKINWYNASITAALALSNGLVSADLPFAIVTPYSKEKSLIAFQASKNIISESMTLVVEKICKNLEINADIDGSSTQTDIIVDTKDVDTLLLQTNAYLMKVRS